MIIISWCYGNSLHVNVKVQLAVSVFGYIFHAIPHQAKSTSSADVGQD